MTRKNGFRQNLAFGENRFLSNVLIFGGAKGIGKACLDRFAANGDRVAFTYNTSADAARELAASLGCRAIRCDVRDADDVDRAVSEALCALGDIDAADRKSVV